MSGRWLTIGATRGNDGKKHGGAPVFVESGRITKGHPRLVGKNIARIGADEERGAKHSHRQDMNRSRDYARAVWAKKARREGVNADDLHQLASEILTHHKEFHADKVRMLKDARQALAKKSGHVRVLRTTDRIEDAAQIPGIDEVAEDLAKRHPHWFPADRHASDVLYSMLRDGNPEAMTESEAYSEAFDHLASAANRFKVKETEMIPFSLDDRATESPRYFRKTIIGPGFHRPPKGLVSVSRDRIKRWVQKFKEMKADGIRVPVPWGHIKAANPVSADRLDSEQFYSSRFNASFVDDLEIGDAGELVLVAKIPPGMELDDNGDLVDKVNHTKVGEVSAAIGNWKDGKGKVWEDTVRHVALCVLPVAHGTPGFQPVADGELRLSLATGSDEEVTLRGPKKSAAPARESRFMRVLALMTKFGIAVSPLHVGTHDPLFVDDQTLQLLTTACRTTIAQSAAIEARARQLEQQDRRREQPTDKVLAELIEALAILGVRLFPGTNRENLLERLEGALAALAGDVNGTFSARFKKYRDPWAAARDSHQYMAQAMMEDRALVFGLPPVDPVVQEVADRLTSHRRRARPR